MIQQASESTQRFSNRVADYIRFRPGYPEALLQTIKDRTDLSTQSNAADMGSRTGISAFLFLQLGVAVFAVEPNKAMREAGESGLSSHANFHSIDARAEQTTLQNSSIDLIISGQAFHWFDLKLTKFEWQRILKPNGFVALFWNSRLRDLDAFQKAYETLIFFFATDYKQVNHQDMPESLFKAFFSGGYDVTTFSNHQLLDFEGLKGRLLSSSYIPSSDHRNYHPMLRNLKQVFEEHQTDGQVKIEYQTELYLGRFK